MVAKESGVELRELVEIHQRKLIEKSLLTDRTFSDRSGIVLGSHFRLPPWQWPSVHSSKHLMRTGLPNQRNESNEEAWE